MSETLCGTCRFWDHAQAERGFLDRTPTPGYRIALCHWGEDLKLPEWCGGLKGYRFTNEAGTTKAGCNAWEPRS